MPVTKDGQRLSIIFNSHGIPSRRTIGMFNEMQVATACARNGTHSSATIFQRFNEQAVADDLNSMGLNSHGYQRLLNGATGEYIDALIFSGPIYYQRLQKFVVDVVYSITHGPSDAMTSQPLDFVKKSKWNLKILLVCTHRQHNQIAGTSRSLVFRTKCTLFYAKQDHYYRNKFHNVIQTS